MLETTQDPPAANLPAVQRARRRQPVFEMRWRNPERGLLDYASAVWARKYTVLLVTFLLGFVGLVYALSKPNTYASKARLMVHGAELSGTATDAAAALLGTGRILPDQVVTAVEIIRSRIVLARLVDSLGYEAILAPYQPPAGDEADSGLFSRLMDAVHRVQARFLSASAVDFGEFGEEELREAAIEALDTNLEVTHAARGTTIQLQYLHTDRFTAQRILAAVMKESIARYGEVVAPPAGQDLVADKVEQAAAETKAANEDVSRFESEHGSLDMTAEIESLNEALAELRAALRAAKLALSENGSVIDSLQAELDNLSPTERVPVEPVFSPEAGQSWQAELQRLRSLRSQHKPGTEAYQTLDRRIRDLLADRESQQTGGEGPIYQNQPNQSYLEIAGMIRDRRVQLIEAKAQIPALEADIEGREAELTRAQQLQREASALSARLEEAEKTLEDFRGLAKTYQFTSELDTRGLTNLRVVDSALLPRTKEGPKRGKILLAAMAAGLIFAVTMLLVRVRLSRRMVRHTDVAFALGRSDVVTLPLLTSRNLQRFEEARRRGWE